MKITLRRLTSLLVTLLLLGLGETTVIKLPKISAIKRTLIKHKHELSNPKQLDRDYPEQTLKEFSILSHYETLPDEEKKKSMDRAIITIRKLFQHLERYPYDLEYSERFSLIIEGFIGANLQIGFGDFLVNVAKIQKRSITNLLNLQMSTANDTIFDIFSRYHRLSNTLIKVIVPSEISPMLFYFLSLMVSPINTWHLKELRTKKATRLCKEYLYQKTGGRIGLEDLWDIHTKNDEENPPTIAYLRSFPMASHNLFYYIQNVEELIMSKGSFYDVMDYLARGVNPIEFNTDPFTSSLICTNHVLTYLYENVNIHPDDKKEIFLQVLERLDPQLPFTCYFTSEIYEARDAIRFFTPFLSFASPANENKWDFFLENRVDDHPVSLAYGLKELKKNQKQYISGYTVTIKDKCEFQEVSEQILKDSEFERTRFCAKVQECRDLSTIIITGTKEQKDLFTMATVFCESTIVRRGLDWLLAGLDTVPSLLDPVLFERIVSYCLEKSYKQLSLASECDILKRWSDTDISKFNIYEREAVDPYLRNGEVSILFDLGFPSRALLNSTRLSSLLPYFNDREEQLMEISGLIKEIATGGPQPNWEPIIWILNRAYIAEDPETFNYLYGLLVTAITQYSKEMNTACPKKYIDPKKVTMSLFCYITPITSSIQTLFPKLKEAIDDIEKREYQLIIYPSLMLRFTLEKHFTVEHY